MINFFLPIFVSTMNYKEEIKTILSYAVLNMISLTSLTLVSAFWNTNYNDMLQIELDDLSVLHYTVISVNLMMILIFWISRI